MRVATLLATNERYLPHCRVAIASMLEHISAGNEYVVYVFHGGMPEKALALLRAMGREHVRVEPICVRERLRDTMRELLWYTREIYFRLMAADVLPEEDKVLYMDCDVIVREDVARLYAEDIGDALLGAYVYPGREADMNAALGTDVQAVFNSGVLLFNLRKWREIGLFERCMEVLERYPTLPCPDQDALAIVCSGRVAPLDHRWNLVTMPPNRHGLYMNGIAHMAAAVKPWTGSGDTNYALYYDVAKRLGVLPPRETPPQTWPGAWWAHRRFSGVRPAPLRAAARRAAGLACAMAAAYVPRCHRYLRHLRVRVTRRCPGDCAHCEMLCPRSRGLAEIDASQLMRDLDSLFARFRVGELYLTGGEPFARPDFAAILRHVLKHSQARVVVETAGLAAPAPDVLPLLRDARVRVESHGRAVAWETPVDAGSRKAPQLRWVWADFGPLARRDCAEDELYWQTRACGANELFYADGRLFACPRMALGLESGAFPESACAFVEVRREKSAWRVERALEAMAQKRCLEACRYCLRGTTAFVPVPPEV